MRKWQKRQNVDPGTHEIRIDVWHAEGLGWMKQLKLRH
jgi:hypothetical protein